MMNGKKRRWPVVLAIGLGTAGLVAGWTLTVVFALGERDAKHNAEQVRGELRTVQAARETAVADAAQARSEAAEGAAEVAAEREAIEEQEAKLKSREEDVRKREREVTKQERVEEKNTIAEGQWAVGVDVSPGTYRT